MAAENQWSKEHTVEFANISNILTFTMSSNFDQQDANSQFVKLAKNGGWIQNGGSKQFFGITLIVFNNFSISLLH
jgi:hypothetical protein